MSVHAAEQGSAIDVVVDEARPGASNPYRTVVPLEEDETRDPGVDWMLEDNRARKEGAMSVDPVRAYLSRIGRTALLSAEQEVELAKRIEAGLLACKVLELVEHDEAGQANGRTLEGGGEISEELAAALNAEGAAELRADLRVLAQDGERAKSHLLEANLRLVVSLAKRYTGRGMPLLDLIQEGNFGLIRAVEKFDYQKGVKFSTYATWWIRQAITRSMADQSRTIRLPVKMHEQLNKLGRLRRDMQRTLCRPPTEEELAAEAGLGVEKVVEILGYSRDPISLDQPVGNEDNSPSLGDIIDEAAGEGVDTQAARNMLLDALHEAIGSLSDREAGIIKGRFGLDRDKPATLKELGSEYDLSQERVRQIVNESLEKLSQSGRTARLFGCLGL